MGLLGDAAKTLADAVTAPLKGFGGIADTAEDTIEGAAQTVDNTEETINDGVKTVSQAVENPIDAGADGVFESAEGFLRFFGDGLNAIAGFAPEPLRSFIKLFGGLFNGMAGVFHFLSTVNGWEGMAALMGAVLIILAVYLFITSFGISTIDSLGIGVPGVGFIMYPTNNVLGSAIVAVFGVLMVWVALSADRGQFFLYGVPAFVVGGYMMFLALQAGALGAFILTFGLGYGILVAQEYLENRLSPRVERDEPLLIGEK